MVFVRDALFALSILAIAGCGGSGDDDGGVSAADASALGDASVAIDAAPAIDASNFDAGPSGCFGSPSAAVQATCEALPIGMQCSPLSGCTGSGNCFPDQTQQDCLLRSLAACGSGIGSNNCRVELGDNPPSTSQCVQTDRASQCDSGDLVDQGSCLTFDGSANTQGGVCRWDDGGAPTCIAMDCIGYPIEQFCNQVDGCNWQN